MNATLTPTSVIELVDAVRATPRVLAVGARTKPRLSHVSPDVTLLSMRQLCGIIEYEPDEYTFTALAGTSLHALAAALAEKGQYLPFDPLLVAAGATLGGTVAAGLNGPGRFRFGGVRDFILGVRFVDGSGRLLRLGGKVVKNAAGFDLPKFFTGSLGRFGVLAELTFKVFPRAASTLTLRLPVAGSEAAVKLLTVAANTRWEPDALDLLPSGDAVVLRLAGPANALPTLAREILARFPGEILAADAAAAIWADLCEFRWTFPDGSLLKLALTPGELPALTAIVRALAGRLHISVGANVAYVSLPAGANPAALSLPALTLRGPGPLWHNPPPAPAISAAVKSALDPLNRFPALAD
ncbi:MAG: FAD-binding protein [Lacunisphaera sp.]|nr:FAD-binding protein [Lacunisphaera sp.]